MLHKKTQKYAIIEEKTRYLTNFNREREKMFHLRANTICFLCLNFR